MNLIYVIILSPLRYFSVNFITGEANDILLIYMRISLYFENLQRKRRSFIFQALLSSLIVNINCIIQVWPGIKFPDIMHFQRFNNIFFRMCWLNIFHKLFEIVHRFLFFQQKLDLMVKWVTRYESINGLEIFQISYFIYKFF